MGHENSKQSSNEPHQPDSDITQKDMVLLGDSTLDNVVWVNGQKECIAHKLRKDGRTVYNLAADGFNSTDMLEGRYPGISYNDRLEGKDPFLVKDILNGATSFSKMSNFKPLEELMQVPNLKDAICVCSFGGNDIREKLRGFGMEDPKEILAKVLQNYMKVLSQILPRCKQIVICTQYFPDQNDDSYGIYRILGYQGVRQLMQHIYPPLLEFAKKHNLAIADFANTFDSKNGALYESQIEPSSLGGDLIVQILDHIVKKHDFSKKSLVYSLENGKIKTKENDGSWTV